MCQINRPVVEGDTVLFKLKKYLDIDKHLEIEGPDLSIKVDFDDVNHRKVLRETKQMVAVLNKFWNADLEE